MIKFLLYLFVAVAAVAAYDFSDSDFNAFLFEDLRDESQDALEPLRRTRRDAADMKNECGHKKDFMCCSHPDAPEIDPKDDAFKIAKKQCQSELLAKNGDDSFDPFNCEKMQQLKEQMFCVTECVAKKLSLIDEKTGDLKRDELVTAIVKKSEKLQWSKEMVEPIADACLAEIKEKKAAGETKGCHQAPLDFHRCLWKFEFLHGCPAEQRVDSPKCKSIRERVGKGDTSVANKHFLYHFLHTRHEE